jgi:amino acid transporter
VAALVPILWAYDGWIDITSIGGEVKTPERNLPRSMVVGMLVVTALYLVVNVAYIRVLGPAFLAQSETPAADAARVAFGERGNIAVSLLVSIATFGGCAVSLMTGSRVLYAVAHDGLFFPVFAKVSSRSVPFVAIVTSGALASVYLTAGIGGFLNKMFVVGAWPFYALAAIGTIVLRRREPSLPRPMRTFAYPFSIVLFVATAAAIVGSYCVTKPKQTALSLGLIVIGVPFRWLFSRRPQPAAATGGAVVPDSGHSGRSGDGRKR